MELTPEMLDAYLRILKDNGVSEFVGNGIMVKFSGVMEPETVPVTEPKKQRSMWEDESLWPDGHPPTFHRKG